MRTMVANASAELPAGQLLRIVRIQSDLAGLGLDLGAVMARVTEHALALVSADGAVIELAEGGEMVYRAAAGCLAAQIGLRLPVTGSLSGLCVDTAQPLRCDDTETDPRVHRDSCRMLGLRSMLVVPLQHNDTVVGVLKVAAMRPTAFDDMHMASLVLLSELIGASMYYATQYAADDLFHRATHDSLTDLPNRSLFMDRLRDTLAKVARDRVVLGVLMIDMDDLKPINDSLGHRAGDRAIQVFAERLRAAARNSDTVARLGGDEFGVIINPVADEAAVIASRERIAAMLDGPFEFDGRVLALGGSVGSACFPQDGPDVAAILEAADLRMYERKRARKAARQAG